ncbi:hypothetical protein PHYPO_G00144050 [Pangasianodon hypophthalmus]|uniref:CUB domain-containing protein n=1 Tax=Pangasianodon hypophthalmus TaxID=310915 RepID=A0A5N5KEM0_PANHP|nr:hypothetical protein PHYPO_G00144050 [Pangasianodon hypophthalmus]
MHCVWQFFVPIGHQLTMELFDFDVFESSERNSTTSEDMITSEDGEEHLLTKRLTRSQPALKDQSVGMTGLGEESNKLESEVSNTVNRVSERLSEPPLSYRAKAKAQSSMFPSSLEDKTEHLPPSSTMENIVMEDESETLQLVTDACPNDVLYITDLITFSSRFCGSKRPSDGQLVFGADAEMVEVIMELITNTHWGRGFALLFRYHNRSNDAAVEVGGQRSSAPSVGAVEALLAAVSLAALFATSLMIVLCVTLRPKLCAKESTVTSSTTSEVPVQNLHTDGSELQLVTANHPEQELNKNDNNPTSPHTGNTLTSPHLTQHRERFLRRSDTGSVQPSDWMPRSEPSNWPSRGSHVGSARPRAWSVRTFHDFLLPLPQLNRKWCSWNLTSPFTKLVDTVSPGSVVDGGGGVKVPSAQQQRRYNMSRSHTSQQICEPDGALCGSEQAVEVKICEFSPDDDNLTIPVFAISEEDDREPLVSAENQVKNNKLGNHDSFPSLGSAHLAFTVEESAVLKNTSSKIQLPSLSHVTVPCDSVGKDM